MYNEIKRIYCVNSYYFNSEVDKLRFSCHFLSFDLLLYIILFCSHRTMFNDVYITMNWENKRITVSAVVVEIIFIICGIFDAHFV